MEKIFAAAQFLKYKIKAGTPHDVHSPFVFDLLNNVILDQTPYYCYSPIESVRAKMLLDQRQVNRHDFGAGNKQSGSQSGSQSVSEIAAKSLQEKKYAQLLFRLINFSKAKNILELGTSLGITSLYLSMADSKNKLITLEGNPEIAAIAQQNFSVLKRENIELLIGDFKTTLPSAIAKLDTLDFVYFDGNHRKEPTLDYFHQCLKKKNPGSVFVFDDIYWSKEMQAAWSEICQHPEVIISIDLFRLGIVFFRSGIPKQHYRLKY